MRAAAALAAAALLALAGCASLPEDDGLLASTSLQRELPREGGDLIDVARFLPCAPGRRCRATG